jgi:hypothetical protein
MSITLTPLASDNFQRANENPLAHPPWNRDSFGDAGLKIASDICEATTTTVICAELYTGQTLPSNQFASFTLASTPHTGSSASAQVGIRMTDNGSSFDSLPGYVLKVFSTSGPGGWALFSGGTSILTGSQNAAANDIWTVAAISTTLYVLQNSTQVGTTTDSTYSSGIAALASFASNTIPDVQYSGFACGLASTTAPVTVYSQPDCRVVPNNSVTVNATLQYTVTPVFSLKYFFDQLFGRTKPLPEDSRAAGAPVACGAYPQNSRKAGEFGPGE